MKWRVSQQTNFGWDFGLWRDRLSVNVDYFEKKSLNQILRLPLPSTSGYANTFVNAGDFLDKGLELGVAFRNSGHRKFRYNINANFNTLTNEILSLGSRQHINMDEYSVRGALRPLRLVVGESLYSYYGYRTGGLFQSEAEVLAHVDSNGNLLQPNAKPGDLKFLKAEGSTGPLDPEKDFVNLGNPFPKFSYAFTVNLEYENWDLSAFFQGVYGNKIFNGLKFITMNPAGGAGQNYNLDRAILEAWSPTNTASSIPRLVARDPSGNYSTLSDYYVEDGSFLRLKSFSIGYRLRSEKLEAAGIRGVRIYASGTNLFTLTKYTGFDPEVGLDYLGLDQGRYPQARNIILGISINL
ncbi:hypothetical protein [Bergeyella sp. RCAD1439]|uniref:hypothetical protein n=1 Tax=Bergeyella anatis TaxID=3113737 RepID=UPI002E18B586